MQPVSPLPPCPGASTPFHAAVMPGMRGHAPHAGLFPGIAPDTSAGLSLYKAIAAQLPHGAVFVVDDQLRYLLADGASLRDAGFQPGDFEGRLLSEALPADVLEQHERDYRSILAGGTIEREHVVNGRDYVSHGAPLVDAEGAVRAALVLSYDISAHKRGERRLRLLDALSESTRAEGRADAFEARAAELLEAYFGARSCRFIAVATQSDVALFDGAVLADLGADACRLLEAGQAVHVDDAASGTWPQLAASVGAFVACPHVAAGRLEGLTLLAAGGARSWRHDEIALLQECADRVWNHAGRLRLMAALQEADRQKDRFLTVLAHELRNPLAVARNGVALLRRDAAAPSGHILALVERQFGHMSRLIEDVLDISQVSRGQLALRRERVVLQDAVASAVEAARTVAERKGLALELSMAPLPLMVDADPVRLAQALGNVIVNSLKYTPAPGAVRVEVGSEEAQATVCIADTGVGMSDATLERLFGLFVRGDEIGLAAAAADGLGIGMWVTRQLLEAHGGSIRAASAGQGRGSAFTITLPLQRAGAIQAMDE